MEDEWHLLMGDGLPRPPTVPDNNMDRVEFLFKVFFFLFSFFFFFSFLFLFFSCSSLFFFSFLWFFLLDFILTLFKKNFNFGWKLVEPLVSLSADGDNLIIEDSSHRIHYVKFTGWIWQVPFFFFFFPIVFFLTIFFLIFFFFQQGKWGLNLPPGFSPFLLCFFYYS